ncbi:YesL family protein [Bacillus sp. IITD106]|nr:YesL family protein [Bacillus sp. IITD106]
MIPIFTIGSSTAALYSVLMKMIKNEDKNIIVSFFISFKRNFIMGTALWLIMVIAGAFIFLDFLLLGSLNGILKFMFTSMVFIFGFVYFCILFSLILPDMKIRLKNQY